MALSGCTNDAETPGDPYAAEFAAARQRATHPDILAALEDDQVTDQEVEQSRRIAEECFQSRGVGASYDHDGNLTVPHPDGANQNDVDAMVDECAGTSYDLLSLLKQGRDENPENISRSREVLDCYQRLGLVSKSMTEDEFKALDWDNTPWPKTDGDAWGCLEDARGYQGGKSDLMPDEVG